MNWQTLLLSPEGRISQKDFWIGVLVLVCLWLVSHFLHVLAPLIWLLLVYPWVCIYAKRLHDFGKSGWLVLLPIVVGIGALCLGLLFGGLGAIGALVAIFTNGAEPSAWAAVFAGLGIMLAFLGLAAIAKLVFMLWVGLSPGDPGDNRYGPPPGALAKAAPST